MSDEFTPYADKIKLANVESSIFSKRDTLKEVQEWIEMHDSESKIHLYTLFGMTLNTMADMIRNGAFEDVVVVDESNEEVVA